MDIETLNTANELNKAILKLEIEIVELEKTRDHLLEKDIREVTITYRYAECKGADTMLYKSSNIKFADKTYFIGMITDMINDVQSASNNLKKELAAL